MMADLSDIFLALLVMTLAFIVGFAIRRGSICMVEASRLLVMEGRPRRLHAFALAAAVSALVIIPLAWVFADAVMLAPDYGVTAGLLVAGCGFGLGARVNGGCAFGTLSRLSGGQIEYAATIIASVGGALWALSDHPIEPVGEGWFAQQGWPGILMLLASAALVWPALSGKNWRNLLAAVRRDKTLLRPTTAMLVVGLLSGLLFALAGSWTHLAVLGRESRALADGGMDSGDLKGAIAAAALVSGAVFAAIRSGRFAWVKPSISGLLKRTIGGGLMGYSAALIPGGNGALLAFGLPSGAASAWAGFAAMIVMLVLLFLPMRLLAARKQAV